MTRKHFIAIAAQLNALYHDERYDRATIVATAEHLCSYLWLINNKFDGIKFMNAVTKELNSK